MLPGARVVVGVGQGSQAASPSLLWKNPSEPRRAGHASDVCQRKGLKVAHGVHSLAPELLNVPAGQIFSLAAPS